jgi:hypothetical protein
MPDIDLLRIVAGALADSPHPVSIKDNRGPSKVPTDPIGLVCDSPPAYHVFVSVNWTPGYAPGAPWVAVTHSGRFGMTPIVGGYTYLAPPEGVNCSDPTAINAWLTPALRAAVAEHAPHAAKAKADDTGTPGPVEAWDALRQIG